jgi:hypothetical protein
VLVLLKQDALWAGRMSGAGETIGRCRTDAGFWMRSSTRCSSAKRSSDATLSGANLRFVAICEHREGKQRSKRRARWLDDNRARLLEALG